jgi:hypothetical protein
MEKMLKKSKTFNYLDKLKVNLQTLRKEFNQQKKNTTMIGPPRQKNNFKKREERK